MALVDVFNKRIEEGSGSGPDGTLTNDEKNHNASVFIHRDLIQTIHCVHNFFASADREIAAAPGTKAEIMTKIGADETEARTAIAALVTFVNAHKSQKDNAGSPWIDESF